MKADVLKIATSVLATAVLAGAASWTTFGMDKVTQDDMHRYVNEGALHGLVKENTRNIGRLEKTVEKVVDLQQRLTVEQRVMVTKVDALLNRGR